MVIKVKLISVVGYSNSGKTQFITTLVKLLREKKKFKVGVLKYVHQHDVDNKKKDSYKYIKSGANFSIIKNDYNEFGLFFKTENELQNIIEWIQNGPLKVHLIFLEGFRSVNCPTVLCIRDLQDVSKQMSKNVKAISGLIVKTLKNIDKLKLRIPVIDPERNFQEFLKLFEIN